MTLERLAGRQFAVQTSTFYDRVEANARRGVRFERPKREGDVRETLRTERPAIVERVAVPTNCVARLDDTGFVPVYRVISSPRALWGPDSFRVPEKASERYAPNSKMGRLLAYQGR